MTAFKPNPLLFDEYKCELVEICAALTVLHLVGSKFCSGLRTDNKVGSRFS